MTLSRTGAIEYYCWKYYSDFCFQPWKASIKFVELLVILNASPNLAESMFRSMVEWSSGDSYSLSGSGRHAVAAVYSSD